MIKINLIFAKIFSFACFFFILQSCSLSTEEKIYNYPEFKPGNTIDQYFGFKVHDRYRALENLSDPLVKKWFLNESKFYDSIMKHVPGRMDIINEIRSNFSLFKSGSDVPKIREHKVFHLIRDIKTKHYELFYRDSINGKDVLIFNTKVLEDSSEGTYSIPYYEPSWNGSRLAFAYSKNGSEMATMRIYDIATKTLLDDVIERVPFGNPQWDESGKAFFYTQLREIKNKEDFNALYENMVVKYHVLNSVPSNDKIVFSGIHKSNISVENIDMPFIHTFPSSDNVILSIYHGASNHTAIYNCKFNDIFKQNKTWTEIAPQSDIVTAFAVKGKDIFMLKSGSFSNGILERQNLDKPESSNILLRENKYVLENFLLTNTYIYINCLYNGINKIVQINLDSNVTREITPPFIGSAEIRSASSIPSSWADSDSLYMTFVSWSKPWAIYFYDCARRKFSRTDFMPETKFDHNNSVEFEELEIPSGDGAKIPLSIVYNKGVKLDGTNPTLLEVYGSHGVSLKPEFSISLQSWLKRGGIYAVAHVRGGGEKGEMWHKSAFKETKFKSWEDYIACAEFLITKKYTSSQKLAGKGESAGAITVGMAMIKNPKLFKAAAIYVGSLNTVRFENTMNTVNTSEFGSIKDSLGFQSLYKMDTYLHIKDNVKYPSILFTAGMNDQLVEPWQPGKVVARMQEVSKQTKNNIILLRLTDQGHSGDSDVVLQQGDLYSFLLWQLGITKNP